MFYNRRKTHGKNISIYLPMMRTQKDSFRDDLGPKKRKNTAKKIPPIFR